MSLENEPTVALSITVKSAADALEFYTRAFGAEELYRMSDPAGGVAHAEFMIGNTKIFISDESEEWHAYAMADGASASCLFGIAVDDCDKSYERAVTAGATALNEPIDMFWGVRSGMVKDPYGYRWTLRQLIEEVSPEEMMRRAEELFSEGTSITTGLNHILTQGVEGLSEVWEYDQVGLVDRFVGEFWSAKQRGGHRLHEVSYRACFKSQLPEFFIKRLTKPGDVVYDCFMGRGTTLIEAALLGRIPVGSDINPLSQFLCAPRLDPPSLVEVEIRLAEIDWNYTGELEDDLLVFYHEDTLRQLYALRRHLLETNNDHVDGWIRMVATNRLSGHSNGFFSVYSMPPNQAVTADRQRIINAKRDQVPPKKDVISRILKKSKQLLEKEEISQSFRECGRQVNIYAASAHDTPKIADNSVDLVVTSPPFLDIVDYAGDNWLRCWFNGIDVNSVEISAFKKPEIWADYMAKVLLELERVLKPGGWIAFEVGEVKKGKVLLEEWVIKAAQQTKLKIAGVMIHQQEFTKTANCWGVDNQTKGTNTQRLTLMQKC